MNASMQTPNTKPLNFLFVQHIPPDDFTEAIVAALDDAMVDGRAVLAADLLWDERLWYPWRSEECICMEGPCTLCTGLFNTHHDICTHEHIKQRLTRGRSSA